MSQLPYVTAPGNIPRALDAIKTAATPPKVTQDFVKTILGIPGGSGDQMTTFLKRIGFANTDGTPTNLYTKFRNTGTSKKAVAAAIRQAYAPLYVRNEYMHELSTDELEGLIVEETGQAADSNVVGLISSAIANLKKYADFSETHTASDQEEAASSAKSSNDFNISLPPAHASPGHQGIGLNLGYTINLNLPATTDIAVFNAIFKSLKEHLLTNDDA
ncbi:DUF5343 domain-containing protein [Hyphomonas sp. WL0036]|uniref:DUF5343 domain-containing protein n=1 Tax=Hyphomonas sediminis TaxID=2866160 RepID=UPI001C7EB9DC|nr:DUF5343 domain-containing protein [Hyphomonas sediminis]MBY9066512.1 DUF5343 domain-containing protein [Hyphomonas sediminis]